MPRPTKQEPGARHYAAYIIRRDAHVSWGLCECVRHVRTRLAKPWRDYPRGLRRAIIAGCADGRLENIKLYAFVQRGIK